MMKYFRLLFILLIVVSSCKKEKLIDEKPYDIAGSYVLDDIPYGSHAHQAMDIYLPAHRSADKTKVFVLIHGGGWGAGDKAEFDVMFDALKLLYPDHAIININYRLGTENNPGYPMQINDIKKALEHIQQDKYDVSDQYFMLGGSAGAHLSMLYGYKYDTKHQVKGICNTVGPTDFTDVSYTGNVLFEYALINWLGPITYAENPELYEETSPAYYVSSLSPPTISFYGDADPLIPTTQMDLLHDKLDALGVINEKYMYAGEGHGNWSQDAANDFGQKLIAFINAHFDY